MRPINWTGHDFVCGTRVLRHGDRVRIGDRTLPGWVLQCGECGAEYTRSSGSVRRSLVEDRTCLCDTCMTKWRASVMACYAGVSITVAGVTRSQKEWARRLGTHSNTIRARVRLGWSHDEAVTVPVGRPRGRGRRSA